MPRPEPEFDGIEGDILIEIYESPEGPFSSYTLTERLNPKLQSTSPEYRTAFAQVCSVIEDHYACGLIRGKRSKGADGVFFDNLKLTYKGEQTAIRERKRRTLAASLKQLPDILKLIREQRDRGPS
jgi:hypothetical protein